MRNDEPKCVSDAGTTPTATDARPSIEELRAAVDARLKSLGKGKRTTELRSVGMSHTTFERILREGLSANPRKDTEKRLEALGVLDLIPKR